MTFADLPNPAPGATENWLWVLGALVILVAAAVSIAVGLKKLIGRQPPIEAEFATRKELAEHMRECAEKRDDLKRELKRDVEKVDAKISEISQDIWRTIREDRNQIDTANEARTAKILTRLGEIEGQIGELRGYVQRQN